MKTYYAAFVLAIALLAGCGDPLLDETLIRVKVVAVKTQSEYESQNGWSADYAHTTVERLDTGERIRMRGDKWGTTGDVFAVKLCNLHW